MNNIAGDLPLSAVLRTLATDSIGKRVDIGELLAAFGDRALSALLFIFAFPNVLPMPPGTSAVLGVPLVFLAAQMIFGLKPWLPAIITRRSMSGSNFQTLVERIAPWLERAEKLLRPRASKLAQPPMEYIVGGVCFLLALLLLLPIPLGNNLPALAISMLALGILARDGYWIVAGLSTAAFAMVVVSSVIFALLKAAIFMLMQVSL
ncbi:MAG: exopolysaccharide synthesis protein ExoD-related protein [Solimicrobium sp.]|jgi:hypothetical protein|nr:exopolysaccharide synthesis protein ExoD-related protein [Solimicrobium sp.]